MTATIGRMDDTEALVRADRDFLWHHIKPHKVFEAAEQMIMVSGRGLRVTDIRGREYLDATSGGVWSVVVGHGRESIADAVCAQLKTLAYYAGSVGNVPTIQFAETLVSLMPGMGKVYFSNSGSEANEKAFKMVRQIARFDPSRKGKYKILFRDRDYHGTTLGALSATGQWERKQDFGPFLEGFAAVPHNLCYRCPFEKKYPGCDIDCARAVEQVIIDEGPDTVGGIILEPVTAGGGIIVPVPEYFPIVGEICRRHGVYLIMDEVVCGFGRTGRFWGYDHFDVAPDMVTMAKGMASSYMPLSATAVRQEIFDRFLCDPSDDGERMNYFRDISTYGGCAAAAAAALETTRIIVSEELVRNSREVGRFFLDRLKALSDMPLVGDVRGLGLFCGIEFVSDKEKKTPVTEAEMNRLMGLVAAEGVLVGRTNSSLPGNNTIMNFAPALVATTADIDEIVRAVRAAIEAF